MSPTHSPSIAVRVQAYLRGRCAPELCAWAEKAGEAYQAQLTDGGGQAHRVFVQPLCTWMNASSSEGEALGNVLDLLQVAIDLTDNLADIDEDRAAGRSYQARYAQIPQATLLALPALLTTAAVECMLTGFAQRPERARYATTRLLGVLSDMALGQGLLDLERKVELVSGRQGLLLCLPLWLADRDLEPEISSAVERWAIAWARTWEYQERFRQLGGALQHHQLKQALDAARAAWPEFGPFADGQALAPGACLPRSIC